MFFGVISLQVQICLDWSSSHRWILPLWLVHLICGIFCFVPSSVIVRKVDYFSWPALEFLSSAISAVYVSTKLPSFLVEDPLGCLRALGWLVPLSFGLPYTYNCCSIKPGKLLLPVQKDPALLMIIWEF